MALCISTVAQLNSQVTFPGGEPGWLLELLQKQLLMMKSVFPTWTPEDIEPTSTAQHPLDHGRSPL